MPSDKPGSERDVQDVLREERARGRRRVDTDAEREQRKFREDYLVLILGDDEAKFREALIALGFQPDSAEIRQHVASWRALKRQRA
jgi:hypothetical protein